MKREPHPRAAPHARSAPDASRHAGQARQAAELPRPVAAPESSGWRRYVSRAELEQLLEIDERRSWLAIGVNWIGIFAAFGVVGLWPNPLTALAAVFVIGARQLGLAVIMHEAAHRTLFRSRRQNDLAGRWLAAYPVWADLDLYRPYHLKHHAHTGTAADPDLGLVAPFPISRASFRRKVLRDLSGRTGLKQLRSTFRRYRELGPRAFAPVALTNGVLLGVLAALGHAGLYGLWVVAWLTTYRLVTRLRSIAEHALAPDPTDPLQNTRTTEANWLERLLLAPNRVNFHLEHHLAMTVPHHNLPRLHALLRERGALEHAFVSKGYLEVFRAAASGPDAPRP